MEIKTLQFADGDSQSVVFHSHGLVDTDEYDETPIEHERLQLDDDGRVGYDRVWIHQKENVAR